MDKNKAIFLPKHDPEQVIDKIMSDSSMCDAMAHVSEKSNGSLASVQNQVKDILKEMISTHHPKWVHASRWIVWGIQKLMFGKIEVQGNLETLRQNNRPILYIPAHRSHMDYLFLSYVLFQNRLPPPIIAAGINLSFFPMGPIFRRLGAFFIRRRISGNAIYKICLEHYMQWLVAHQQHIECYPEGGRSRDGMIRNPQTGLFQLLYQAMCHANQPFDIVPVAIGYDFVPDMPEFAKEELGESKKQDSIWKLLRGASRVQNHGAIHFKFLPAIPSTAVASDLPVKEKSQELLNKTFNDIQDNTPITAIEVVACALLCIEDEAPEEEIFEQAMAIRKQLLEFEDQFAPCLKNLEARFPKLVEWLLAKRWLERKAPYRYRIVASARIAMNYQRHSILHYFLPGFLRTTPHPETMRKFWADYFPFIGSKWLFPPLNSKPHSIWPRLPQMMDHIMEPYKSTLEELAQHDGCPRARPENWTPAKIQQAKNWLKKTETDTVQKILNIG
jgi:glycerol-3-phosphate O-acyltransferase